MNNSKFNHNEEGAEYVFVPGGSFNFSVTGKKEYVPDLYVAKYPVTNQLYRNFIAFFNSEKSSFPPILPLEKYSRQLFEMANSIEGFGEYLQRRQTSLVDVLRSSCCDVAGFCENKKPVVGVSWYAAKAYCLWNSLMESINGENPNLYRLPTEIEWEYAAAGKEGRNYPWGNKELTPELANYESNVGTITPVGIYPKGATPEGLCDMAGNVCEWMENEPHKLVGHKQHSVRGGAWSGWGYSLACNHNSSYYCAVLFKI